VQEKGPSLTEGLLETLETLHMAEIQGWPWTRAIKRTADVGRDLTRDTRAAPPVVTREDARDSRSRPEEISLDKLQLTITSCRERT
jgi:hypothetical protein